MASGNSQSESTLGLTANTPPESLADFLEVQDPVQSKTINSSVPFPGSTFIIQDTKSGNAITLRSGKLILAPIGGPGCYRWECVSHDGWLGFRDPASNLLISYDDSKKVKGMLSCIVRQHDEWEHFCVMPQPEGGYILMMTHWKKIFPVGLRTHEGETRLARIGHDSHKSDPIIWQFTKV